MITIITMILNVVFMTAGCRSANKISRSENTPKAISHAVDALLYFGTNAFMWICFVLTKIFEKL